MDQATWGALALVLTIIFGTYTVQAFRRRGVRAGVRGAAVTLLPPAAYLTGTLRMFTRIVNAVVDWLTSLVFSPSVWVGFILLFVAVVLFGVSGRMGPRAPRTTSPATPASPKAAGGASPMGSLGAPAARKGKPVIDDDLADIEAILRKRGIS